MTRLYEGKKDWEHDVIKEGEDSILYIYVEGINYAPSVEDYTTIMSKTIELLTQISGVTKIIFSQKREYEYDYNQTQILVEISEIYKRIIREKNIFSYNAVGLGQLNLQYLNKRFTDLQNLAFKMLKSDPIGAYVDMARILRKEKIDLEKVTDPKFGEIVKRFISALTFLLGMLDKTKLISQARPYIPGYKVGDRSIYRYIFTPTIKPDFMFTKLMSTFPPDGEEIDSYTIDGDTEVTVFKFADDIKVLYHIVPPEFKLNEDKYELLDLARKIMAEHKPREEEFTDPERMRDVFVNIGKDLIEELSKSKNILLRAKEIDKLADILVRYTVGFGLIEVLLKDEKIQDISINSPMGKIPMFIVHADHGDCYTNVIPTKTESEGWASKLRLISGRPLDEANPILDTELELPNASTRVSVISRPLNPTGLAYSFRRHRDKPWTLPLFMKYKMIDPISAGLLSFLVDGTRTMLIAGTRSAGKSSLLSAMLVEIMRKYRIITIEDTLELPTKQLRELGFNLQSMKVASALAKESTEVDASTGIRTTLRLGDSALIVGEVRSKEAIALYEAMRVGAAANVVAGTIHSDSPYGIYDRVVNDIGIPKTSFKATDVCIVANPIRSADGLHRSRRVTQITEVRKHWENDPLAEGGFVDLMKYNSDTDKLEVTDDLQNGDSEVLKAIAGNIKEFAGNWDAVWENIMLRGKIKQAIVDAAEKSNRPELLEAPFVIKCNDYFHNVTEKVREDIGKLDSKRIFFEWNEWLQRHIRKKTV
ncbi:type II/IV secretion system ATPase subunit [Candidatus Woesearchaeota archaeon]|jgi:archaeal flagellar protein FlaI|nr:type II/IV secretion system ATPase subunit [Candidatus Woesearchaeota archaeon]MBT5272755.1 type II/IV secretion system ATPase subunit [Candidatus Woesearchaeota archaeon]MBT6040367.1 type II/IV secretion system ATPase subunit [Candidatus Woesearchaeota archaeon]MBT6337000.1 type II/IV secretion system ATPase subunit [Candidatus Woesearchaeota archaeon]MBT7926886.1 type II/IV secretion system ATPase subunit [Candidatus Woesearchaeota archaeon]